MKYKVSILIFISILPIGFNSYAGGSVPATLTTTVGSAQTETENRAYAGLVWTLQEKMSAIPDMTLGFRSLRVKSTDSVNGIEFNARIKLKEGISLDSTRLSYVGGERNLLGNVGVGYSVTNSSMLGTLAVQGAYSRLGADYQLNGNKFSPYLELLSTDKPNKVSNTPSSSQYVCSNPAYPVLGSGNVCSPEQVLISDLRLKYKVNHITTLSNGLKLYSFKYKTHKGHFVGVMAQDLLKNTRWSKAVVQHKDGYYMVNYGMLGLKMTTLENWLKNGKNSILINK